VRGEALYSHTALSRRDGLDAPPLYGGMGNGADENDCCGRPDHRRSIGRLLAPRGKVIDNGLPRFSNCLGGAVAEDECGSRVELANASKRRAAYRIAGQIRGGLIRKTRPREHRGRDCCVARTVRAPSSAARWCRFARPHKAKPRGLGDDTRWTRTDYPGQQFKRISRNVVRLGPQGHMQATGRAPALQADYFDSGE